MRDKGKPQRSSCGDVPMSPSAPPEPSGRPKRQLAPPKWNEEYMDPNLTTQEEMRGRPKPPPGAKRGRPRKVPLAAGVPLSSRDATEDEASRQGEGSDGDGEQLGAKRRRMALYQPPGAWAAQPPPQQPPQALPAWQAHGSALQGRAAAGVPTGSAPWGSVVAMVQSVWEASQGRTGLAAGAGRLSADTVAGLGSWQQEQEDARGLRSKVWGGGGAWALQLQPAPPERPLRTKRKTVPPKAWDELYVDPNNVSLQRPPQPPRFLVEQRYGSPLAAGTGRRVGKGTWMRAESSEEEEEEEEEEEKGYLLARNTESKEQPPQRNRSGGVSVQHPAQPSSSSDDSQPQPLCPPLWFGQSTKKVVRGLPAWAPAAVRGTGMWGVVKEQPAVEQQPCEPREFLNRGEARPDVPISEAEEVAQAMRPLLKKQQQHQHQHQQQPAPSVPQPISWQTAILGDTSSARVGPAHALPLAPGVGAVAGDKLVAAEGAVVAQCRAGSAGGDAGGPVEVFVPGRPGAPPCSRPGAHSTEGGVVEVGEEGAQRERERGGSKEEREREGEGEGEMEMEGGKKKKEGVGQGERDSEGRGGGRGEAEGREMQERVRQEEEKRQHQADNGCRLRQVQPGGSCTPAGNADTSKVEGGEGGSAQVLPQPGQPCRERRPQHAVDAKVPARLLRAHRLQHAAADVEPNKEGGRGAEGKGVVGQAAATAWTKRLRQQQQQESPGQAGKRGRGRPPKEVGPSVALQAAAKAGPAGRPRQQPLPPSTPPSLPPPQQQQLQEPQGQVGKRGRGRPKKGAGLSAAQQAAAEAGLARRPQQQLLPPLTLPPPPHQQPQPQESKGPAGKRGPGRPKKEVGLDAAPQSATRADPEGRPQQQPPSPPPPQQQQQGSQGPAGKQGRGRPKKAIGLGAAEQVAAEAGSAKRPRQQPQSPPLLPQQQQNQQQQKPQGLEGKRGRGRPKKAGPSAAQLAPAKAGPAGRLRQQPPVASLLTSRLRQQRRMPVRKRGRPPKAGKGPLS